MHPRFHAAIRPNRLAAITAGTDETITFGELEDRANQGAHLIRRLGLQTGDGIAIWLPNCIAYFEIYWAAQRSGLRITPISTAFNAEETTYILHDSGSKLLITNSAISGADELLRDYRVKLPSLRFVFSINDNRPGLSNWNSEISCEPTRPIEDERPGVLFMYSSGTTGRPKGIQLPLPVGAATQAHPPAERQRVLYGINENTLLLSPAPLYHAAPLAYCTSVQRHGGTAIVMMKFDAEDMLRTIQTYKITVAQMVPTMFSRLLRLSEAARSAYDLASLEKIIHAAAPCPVDLKKRMIGWLGPIIDEYYSGAEGNGATAISCTEWLKKPGSVGRAQLGIIHICNDDGVELPPGESGLVYFQDGPKFEYMNDPEKTRSSRHPLHPSWSTIGDVGYQDVDGYLFLTDRKSFMIISGGVNIYPQEVENLLSGHPLIADVAVIGVPDLDMGEVVKAVVQPVNWTDATPAFGAEIMNHCRKHLSSIKCPRSVDFEREMPRHDNGKLYKRLIRDRYWEGFEKRIAC